ncbi:uncharacterized protein M421DRAFT_420617 [Didymella exigua CBS 183.55]|uniref:GPI anchored cell wall protein n=1 Tax=Didymella exigua CBS 183.55 TaxID=1150837 RepID=A0A6A5RN53_9PLEO|nr:uncharacterized protein M421DRAFT_420617 [Didymella exigua CBS 183.55]KAF1928720.1 hypothetical protein M421DRAFT_420617 [Didymella exigua CBS 183.55]
MLAKTVFAAAFFALARFVIATPPGCLLGAVNEYSDPSDLKTVCKAKDLTTQIAKFCGDDTKAALSAVADICNDQGVKVSTDVPTSTGSVQSSGTGASASATGTGSISVSGSNNGTLATATGSTPKPSGTAASGTSTGGLAQSTGAAGKLEIGLAAAVAGVMAFAL